MQNDTTRSWKKQITAQCETISYSPANSPIESKHLLQVGVSKYLSACCQRALDRQPGFERFTFSG